MLMVAVAIVGCAGYTGQETLDRVLAPPAFEVVALGSDSLAGEPAGALDLRLNGHLPPFVSNEGTRAAAAGLFFIFPPPARAAELEPPAGAVVVDLSGAHRLDADLYPAWYGFEHPQRAGLGA